MTTSSVWAWRCPYYLHSQQQEGDHSAKRKQGKADVGCVHRCVCSGSCVFLPFRHIGPARTEEGAPTHLVHMARALSRCAWSMLSFLNCFSRSLLVGPFAARHTRKGPGQCVAGAAPRPPRCSNRPPYDSLRLPSPPAQPGMHPRQRRATPRGPDLHVLALLVHEGLLQRPPVKVLVPPASVLVAP